MTKTPQTWLGSKWLRIGLALLICPMAAYAGVCLGLWVAMRFGDRDVGSAFMFCAYTPVFVVALTGGSLILIMRIGRPAKQIADQSLAWIEHRGAAGPAADL